MNLSTTGPTLTPMREQDVVGYGGRYRVFEDGTVVSYVYPHKPRILKPGLCSNGHYTVSLTLDGKRRTVQVHQIVMLAFVGPPPPGMQVRHLNGDPANNHLSNLRYGTISENAQDRLLHGNHNHAFKTHCPANHEYTPENTWVSKNGWRYCRACHRARRAAARAAKRAVSAAA